MERADLSAFFYVGPALATVPAKPWTNILTFFSLSHISKKFMQKKPLITRMNADGPTLIRVYPSHPRKNY